MKKFIEECNTIFARLEQMGINTNKTEYFKVLLLLASMSPTFQLESAVAAFRIKHKNDLPLETVVSELIHK